MILAGTHALFSYKAGATISVQATYNAPPSSLSISPLPSALAFWIRTDTPEGALIDVDGDPMHGFIHRTRYDYDLTKELEASQMKLIELGPAPAKAVEVVQEIALRVAPPEKSLREGRNHQLATRVTMQNCQTWLSDVVDVMVEEGVLGKEAKQVVRSAPRN